MSEGLCIHLDPQEGTIDNEGEESWIISEKAPYHDCSVKEAMGREDVECPFSLMERGELGEWEAIVFNEKNAKGCPLYSAERSKLSEAILYQIQSFRRQLE